MKITKYIGALAFVAMLAACSNEEEQGINTLSNVVEVTANVGKNSIFTAYLHSSVDEVIQRCSIAYT